MHKQQKWHKKNILTPHYQVSFIVWFQFTCDFLHIHLIILYILKAETCKDAQKMFDKMTIKIIQKCFAKIYMVTNTDKQSLQFKKDTISECHYDNCDYRKYCTCTYTCFHISAFSKMYKQKYFQISDVKSQFFSDKLRVLI